MQIISQDKTMSVEGQIKNVKKFNLKPKSNFQLLKKSVKGKVFSTIKYKKILTTRYAETRLQE